MNLYDDALILAETFMDPAEWVYCDDGDYGDGKYHCSHCSGASLEVDHNNPRSIKHDVDCVMLVALDILTGAEG